MYLSFLLFVKGAWTFIQPYLNTVIHECYGVEPRGTGLHYIGRPAMAAPAEGLGQIHKQRQEQILRDVVSFCSSQPMAEGEYGRSAVA